MAEGGHPIDKLLVALQDGTALVRVLGRGSFKVSATMKEFATTAIDRGCKRLVLDMGDCVGMDSTFMGVLAGLAFRLKKLSGNIVMVNLSLRTRGLLSTLGLDEVIEPHMAGDMPDNLKDVIPNRSEDLQSLENPERDSRETAATMLEAHENLVKLSPENLPKFKDVLAFLQEDVRKSQESEKKSE